MNGKHIRIFLPDSYSPETFYKWAYHTYKGPHGIVEVWITVKAVRAPSGIEKLWYVATEEEFQQALQAAEEFVSRERWPWCPKCGSTSVSCLPPGYEETYEDRRAHLQCLACSHQWAEEFKHG